eukprot:s3516_g5.t1
MGCAASVSAGLSAGPSARLQRQKADIACSFRRVVPSRTDDRDCMARDKQQSVPTSRQQRMVKLRDVHAKRRDVRATSEVTACASMKETAAPSAAGELPGFENVVEIEASLLESWKSWSSPRLRDPEGRPVPSPPDRHLHNRTATRNSTAATWRKHTPPSSRLWPSAAVMKHTSQLAMQAFWSRRWPLSRHLSTDCILNECCRPSERMFRSGADTAMTSGGDVLALPAAGVLANENTGFTEDQVRDAVKRQLAIAQAEANEAHSAQIAPGAEDGWDGA